MEVIVLATMDVVDVMFSPPCLTNLNPRHQHYHFRSASFSRCLQLIATDAGSAP